VLAARAVLAGLTCLLLAACTGGEVVQYRMNGGGHQAPRTIAGRSFAQVVWDFFAAHPLPG
jgi:hypothetical protein